MVSTGIQTAAWCQLVHQLESLQLNHWNLELNTMRGGTGGIVVADVTQGLPRVEELFEVRMPKVLSQFLILRKSCYSRRHRTWYLCCQNNINWQEQRVSLILVTNQLKLTVQDGQLIATGQSFVKVTWTLKVLSIQREFTWGTTVSDAWNSKSVWVTGYRYSR